jgi:hypothetical protein
VKTTLLGTTVTGAGAGNGFGCAVRSDGTLWCWGADSVGQVGDGTNLTVRPLPMRLPLGVCSSDACNDGLKDGTETDIDCGGACLASGLVCADGKTCAATADCNSGYVSGCSMNVCFNECADGVKDGTETDVDCGGLCGGCADGKHCNSVSDCTGDICSNNTCFTTPPCGQSGDPCSANSDCCNGFCSVSDGFC